MKYLQYSFFIVFFFLIRCNDDLAINTDKNTYFDDISDICFVNDHFFTTNYDRSGNSGDQIDLIRFTSDGSSPDDAFNLNMNGQGYLAMTTDGSDIYMQSRANGAIIKCSLIGEKAYMKWDTLNTNLWQPTGICYVPEKDSLVLLYRNLDSPKFYKIRTVSKTTPSASGSEHSFTVAFIDTTHYGIYALTYKDDHFYMLGVDTLIQDKLLRMDNQFNLISVENIPDSTVVGLCFKDNDLYLSYRDRRIENWETYQK